jgi:RNA recognition motif-containing protein
VERAEPGSTNLRRVPRSGEAVSPPVPSWVGGVCILPRREQGNAIDGKLQVRNLSTDTTEAELTELFARFGEVLDALIVRDGSSRMSKGYGFVTMSALSEADAAVSRLDGHVLQGSVLKVQLTRARTVRGNEGAKRVAPREGREQ